jgi:putative SOS response-associated peptidase YedK
MRTESQSFREDKAFVLASNHHPQKRGSVTSGDSLGIRQPYPCWAKDPTIGLRTISARLRPSRPLQRFARPSSTAGYLVPADTFYEWQKLDAKNKQPFAIALKSSEPCALAGLGEKWKDRGAGAELLTFTVITTDPNEVVQPMHDRMSVIIPERDYDRWLQPRDPQPSAD